MIQYHHQQQKKKENWVTNLGATRPAQQQQQDETDVKKKKKTSSSTTSSLQEPDMKAFAAGYKTVFKELPFMSCYPSVGTTVPDDLEGTYFRAGPAMFSAGSIVPPKTSTLKKLNKILEENYTEGGSSLSFVLAK